jgi:hypothetical protein
MHLGWFISGVSEIVFAIVRCVWSEELSDGFADGVECACGGFVQQMLELGENLFDGVESVE